MSGPMEDQSQTQGQSMPEEPDEFQDQIKATIDSISPQDQDLEFYANGLVNFAEMLNSEAIRKSFKKNQGFSVLIRNEKIREVMAKTIHEMYPDECQVLKSAIILAKAATQGNRDNTIRAIQIRGILDNVFEMCASEHRVPDDVCVECIQFVSSILKDTSVCKLMCNKYDLSEVKPFDSDYGDWGQHFIHANFWRMLHTNGSPQVRREAYRLVETICHCERFYNRVVDQSNENIDRLAQAIREGLVPASQQPASFGAFCDAVYRLTQHTRVREALMRQPGLLAQARQAIESIIYEVSSDGTASLGQMFLCLKMLLLDMQPSEVLAEGAPIAEIANSIQESNRPATVRRCARAAASALEIKRLEAEGKLDVMFKACRQMFLEYYDATTNKTDELEPTPQLIPDGKKLLDLLNGRELFDAPPLFFCGALQCLGETMASVRDSELYKKFKENSGFEMLVRHRSIPKFLRLPLSEKGLYHRFVMTSVWSLGLAVMPDNRDTLIRFIQMPNVIDDAVAMIQEPNAYPSLMRLVSMRVLTAVCSNPEICRMVCNRVDFPPFMIKLLSVPITIDCSAEIEELQYQLFKHLSQCQKLIYRLAEENHYEELITGMETLISNGWERPQTFRRFLECACKILGSSRVRDRPFHRPSMIEAVSTAVGILQSMMDGVTDEEASVNLIKFTDLILRRQRDDDLLESLRIVAVAEYLPEATRAKAADVVKQITFKDDVPSTAAQA